MMYPEIESAVMTFRVGPTQLVVEVNQVPGAALTNVKVDRHLEDGRVLPGTGFVSEDLTTTFRVLGLTDEFKYAMPTAQAWLLGAPGTEGEPQPPYDVDGTIQSFVRPQPPEAWAARVRAAKVQQKKLDAKLDALLSPYAVKTRSGWRMVVSTGLVYFRVRRVGGTWVRVNVHYYPDAEHKGCLAGSFSWRDAQKLARSLNPALSHP